METHIYFIKILGENGVTIHVYHEGPEGMEEEIIDYLWQEYFEFQPDKNLYKIRNLTLENSDYSIDIKLNKIHFHLARRAMDYVEDYS